MLRLTPPIVAVNYKVYPQATGPRAAELTRLLEEAAGDAPGTVAVCPTALDLAGVAAATGLPVLAQHVDALPPGRGTGHLTAENARDAGAVGTLLNHSERPLPSSDVAGALARCREAGLEVVVCAADVEAARTVADLGPDYVAVEPPELIGGDVSVTTADPAIVQDTVEAVAATDPDVGVLCGAGVKTGEDVATALELGADGVLLASGVAKAQDPGKVLRDLLAGV